MCIFIDLILKSKTSDTLEIAIVDIQNDERISESLIF